MRIRAKIIEVNPDGHKITVRFWSDEFPPTEVSPGRCEFDRSIDVPLPHPETADMAKMLAAHARVIESVMERRKALEDPNISKAMGASHYHLNEGTVFELGSSVAPGQTMHIDPHEAEHPTVAGL
jgi:hypothetical protein